ncbi:acyl carrier protein [Sphingomonas bacterium]|uniref:acyl carrier protein n=1 Tax=Sphingomonas bacterium TaxID=1895847 RepID=UPI0020C5EB21|nr:acyl carrier protein [Sphingomonas bacterium]
MDREAIIKRLVPLMEDVFDEDDLEYSDDLSADEIEEWDSLSHVRFIAATEKAFGVRFSTGEIEGFKNSGELVDALAAKLG